MGVVEDEVVEILTQTYLALLSPRRYPTVPIVVSEATLWPNVGSYVTIKTSNLLLTTKIPLINNKNNLSKSKSLSNKSLA